MASKLVDTPIKEHITAPCHEKTLFISDFPNISVDAKDTDRPSVAPIYPPDLDSFLLSVREISLIKSTNSLSFRLSKCSSTISFI